jgi:hypothetical protein
MSRPGVTSVFRAAVKLIAVLSSSVESHRIVLPRLRIRPYFTVITVTTVTTSRISFIYAASPCDAVLRRVVTVTVRTVTN